MWDACEAVGVKLGPSAFDESHHEQRNVFLPEADDEVTFLNVPRLCIDGWVRPIVLTYGSHGFVQVHYRAVVYTNAFLGPSLVIGRRPACATHHLHQTAKFSSIISVLVRPPPQSR